MIYIILFFLSFILTYFIKNIAIKKSLIAEINERSSHTVPTPYGGGIAIAVTWFVGLFYLYFNKQIEINLLAALLVGIIIGTVSYFDDIFELSAKFRLLMQSIVAILGLYCLGGFHQLDLFVFTIKNPIINNIFAFFLIVWFINLYNFLDGIDGYAASEAIFLGIAGFILFGGSHFLIFTTAVGGFLVWNWHKAKIFMGDVGSTLLGYTVAIFTIYYANLQSSDFWVWIVLFGLFWFDATFTLFRRYKNGENLSKPHKKHAYQRLVQSGWSHDKVVKYALVVNIFLFVLVYLINNAFIVFAVSLFIFYTLTKFVDKIKSYS
jgi:Fuc2NAc and GlcNAc transferase